MKEIEIYGVSAASDGAAPKGSASNPYTYQEFEAMADNGTWEGGYVEGYGYVDKGVTISGSSEDSEDSYSWEDTWSSLPSDPFYDFGSWSDTASGSNNGETSGANTDSGYNSSDKKNPYPQISKTVEGTAILYNLVENMGLQASFKYQYAFSISGYRMFLSAGYFTLPTILTGKDYMATAIVEYENGTKKYSLEYPKDGYISSANLHVIGNCEFNLPTSGKVKVFLQIAFFCDTGIGYTNAGTETQVYP